MAGLKRPEDFNCWRLSHELKLRVYAFTATGSAARDFKFRDEIREASRSALDNIAEGFYRYAPREFNRFLNITRGSLGEVRNQLIHAKDEAHLSELEFKELFELADRAIGATTKLQEYLQNCPDFLNKKPLKRNHKPKGPPNPAPKNPAPKNPAPKNPAPKNPAPGTRNPAT